MYIYIYIRGRRLPSPSTVCTRANIPVALYRGQEAEDCGFLYRGHGGEDSRRPLPWARGRRFRSPFTVGPRPKTPVALYRGPEADDFRRPLLWARGRRFPLPLTVGRGRSPVVFTVSRRTVGTRAGIPVVSTVSRNSALAFYRGDEGEDSRRPLPWARGRRFPSPFTVGTRLRIAVALYRGPEAVDSRPWARG